MNEPKRDRQFEIDMLLTRKWNAETALAGGRLPATEKDALVIKIAHLKAEIEALRAQIETPKET